MLQVHNIRYVAQMHASLFVSQFILDKLVNPLPYVGLQLWKLVSTVWSNLCSLKISL
jgi:hypothetical protein